MIRLMPFPGGVILGSLFLIFLITAGLAQANPAPLSVSGALVEGEDVVVTGSGFGTKSEAAALFFDTQEKVWINGVVFRPYEDVPDGGSVTSVSSPVWAGGKGVQLRRDNGYTRYFSNFSENSQDAYLNRPDPWPDAGTRQVTEVYIRWWQRFSFDPDDRSYSSDGSGTSAKFIRIWDSAGSTEKGIRISWTQMHMTGMGDPSWSNWNGPGDVGAWNLFEIYLNARTGSFRAAINGIVVHDKSNHSFGDYDGIVPRQWGIDGSGKRNWSGETMEFSDYYADNTRARIEIGDAPQWSDVDIREPQIPLEWSPDEVRIELYRGRLDTFDGKFLYIIDSEGRVNSNGLPLGLPQPKPPELSAVDRATAG